MRFKLFLFLLLFSSAYAVPGFHEPWGKHADLKIQKTENKEPIKASIMQSAMEKVILFHQNVISPVDGPRSHFRPSSSAYMKEAMRKYGFAKGFVMGCDRLLRENEDEWLYRKIEIDGVLYKWDPP